MTRSIINLLADLMPNDDKGLEIIIDGNLTPVLPSSLKG
jgi:hypothetical protein